MAAEAARVMLDPFQILFEKLDRIEKEIQELKSQKQEVPNQEKFLSCKEVESLLKISAPTRIALAKSGRLIPKKLGRKCLYPMADVNEALRSYNKWTRF